MGCFDLKENYVEIQKETGKNLGFLLKIDQFPEHSRKLQ